MRSRDHLLDVAIQYHDALPKRIREYLNGRGIPDEVVNSHLLGWNGWRITIPIYNRDGEIVFFRLAKDPQDPRPGPKILTSPGASVELYGWERVISQPSQIIICEGEFDRLVLEANGFAAVTSTGGAATFRPQWAQELSVIERVYVCFDRDRAGRNGAMIAGLMIPHARMVELSEEVGEGGDVTDFFSRLGKTREQFLELLARARTIRQSPPASRPASAPRQDAEDTPLRQRIERIKGDVPIVSVIEQYVRLRPSGNTLVGRCPFHKDRTPSLTVYPATGTYHCFGCRAHGDVISFVRAMEKLSFAQTLDVLGQITSNYEPGNQEDSRKGEAA